MGGAAVGRHAGGPWWDGLSHNDVAKDGCLSMQDVERQAWDGGYTIAELWGFTAPVTRLTSEIDADHPILWGILAMAEYQVDRGAGHRYLRDRLAAQDWAAFGYEAGGSEPDAVQRVPRFPDAKFGRRRSEIGDGLRVFTQVRVVHAHLLAVIGAAAPPTR